jgi:type II secretory pathway component GspD/PulD (secretin)
MRKLLTATCFIIISLVTHSAWAQPALKIITLQHRFAQDLLPAIQPLVGEDGTASAVDNHLFIRAAPERMQAIEQVIATLDVTRKNVRITVSHTDTSQTQGSRAGVSGRVQAGDVEIQTSQGAYNSVPDGVRLDIDNRQSSNVRSGTEFVTVMDGERAFIRVGQSVPYTQQWVQLTRQYISAGQTTTFQDITTGFAVRPRYIGDQVELEITPRIASLNRGNVIDFEELSTIIRVTPGQWFDVGGSMQSRDDVSRAILSQRERSGDSSNHLRIKVD